MSGNQVKDRSQIRRFIIPFVLIAVGVVVELINWTTKITAEKLLPQFGTSSQAVLGRGVAFLIIGLLLFWLLVTRQVSWKSKGIAFGIAALIGVGLAASIREIENTGDNRMVIHYRWQPTREQRLNEYQKTAPRVSESFQLDPSAPRFTNFLGPQRNGVVPGSSLQTDLVTHVPREIWRRPVGGGYAGCVIAGGLAVSIEQRDEQEVIVAYDLTTGADRWTRGYAGHFKESLGGNGPRATPTIEGDEVFALGASGLLVSLDLANGEENWTTNILTDAGANNIQWGMSGAPLVSGDLVIVNPGGIEGNAVLAYDRATGQRKWSAGSGQAGYSSPVAADVCGVAQVLVLDADSIAGYQLDSGTELWQYPFSTFNGINVGQPLLLPDDRVFVSAGYDSGALLLQIRKEGDQWSAEPVWKNKRMKCKMGTAVYREGYLYGLDDGILACLDAKTGDRKWKSGRYGHGQILLRDDVLIIMAETGDLVLVNATPESHRELARISMLPGGKTWNAPALAGNQLLLRNHFEAVLLELPLRN